jgi:MFS family permease
MDRAAARQWWCSNVSERLVLRLGQAQVFVQKEEEIAKRLYSADDAVSAALLAEAEAIDRRQYDSVESIERRAMTLQAAVAIAATLTLAAGGLLLDPAKIESQSWRIAFAVALLLPAAAFIASGVRALGASSRTHPWTVPSAEDIFDHAKLDLRRIHAVRAAAYVKSAGMNVRIVEVKAGYLNASVRWFRIALVLLVLVAASFLAYTIWGQSGTIASNRQPSANLSQQRPREHAAKPIDAPTPRGQAPIAEPSPGRRIKRRP